jgi:hypothetical protein
MMRLIAADSAEILRFTAIGAEASELMTAIQTAMIGRSHYTALRGAIFTHPTAAEGLTFLMKERPRIHPRPSLTTPKGRSHALGSEVQWLLS